MPQPRVVINLDKIVHNYHEISARAGAAGIRLTGVLKATAGNSRIAGAMVEAGLMELGDSRLENLIKYRQFNKVRRICLRLPPLSRLDELAAVSDVSLHTETTVLEALDRSSEKGHQVMLMVDLGDLREGVAPENIMELGRFCRGLKNIVVTGLGANFSCFSGLIPTEEKLQELVDLASRLREDCRLPVEYISGGNSSSLHLLYHGKIPAGVNHLRIGEGILLGRETLTGSVLPKLYSDTFLVEAEVLQCQWKTDQPHGETGRDAFGRVPSTPVVGAGWRVLLAIGHQDTPLDGLTPTEPGLVVLGGSSDYMVLASDHKLKIGQIIRFYPNYWSLLGMMTSPYVTKSFR